jgi:hypothetical protein
MAAAVHNIAIEAGSNFTITFQYLDVNENPIDLTGYCITFLMKSSTGRAYGFSSNNSAASLLTNGWTLLTDQNNITFALSSSETAKIPWLQGVYDLYVTENSVPKKKFRIATGSVTVIANNFPECANTVCGDEAECIEVLNQSLVTPTPTQGPPPTPTPTPAANSSGPIGPDICERFCNGLDIDAIMYIGSGLSIIDNSSVSGTISIADNGRVLQNIELMINRLKHPYPQDLAFVLVPPTGNSILLSAHEKIKNNNPINGFSYIVSNKAAPGVYISNVINNDKIKHLTMQNKKRDLVYMLEDLSLTISFESVNLY